MYQDQLNPVAELDENGHIESVFVYGPKSNVPAYMVRDGTAYRILSNHLGSVRLVVNTENGNVVQQPSDKASHHGSKDPEFPPRHSGLSGNLPGIILM